MKRLPLYLVISGIAFAVLTRIILPWGQTFTPGGVMLNTPDAYAMLRYADTFPFQIPWDYFTNYPQGQPAFAYTVWSTVAAVLARICRIDNVTMLAILPPVAFSLAAWYVYTATRRLYGSMVAAGAFFTLCLLPGEILNRTMLGAGDYHCWEILLVCCIMSLTIQAIQADSPVTKILISIGIALACLVYWLSWAGAPVVLLIFALSIYIWLMLPAAKGKGKYAGMAIGLLIIAALLALNPGIITKALSVLTPDLEQGTTEAMPLFFTSGQIDPNIIMGYFGITFYTMLLGFGWLAYLIVRKQRKEDILLLSWSLVMFAMTLGQRRFDYYFAINVAIFSSLVIVKIVSHMGRRQVAYAAIVLAAVLCIPLAKQSISLAMSDFGRMPLDWQQTCQWLKKQNSNAQQYPAGALAPYGVFSWWNSGYWLTGMGHQAVYCENGNQDTHGASAVLLSQDTVYSLKFLASHNFKYLVIDQDMFKSHNLQKIPLAQTFMYQAYAGQVPQAQLVFQSGQVRVFDVTIAAGKSP